MSQTANYKLRYFVGGCTVGFLLAYLTSFVSPTSQAEKLPCSGLATVPHDTSVVSIARHEEVSSHVQPQEAKKVSDDLPTSHSDDKAKTILKAELPLAKQIPSPSPSGHRSHSPRHVYLDMGANWANTLRLFKEIGGRSERNAHYEVYAFEANPFIQAYVDNFVGYLNGCRTKPPLTVPPAGSHGHLHMFAKRFRCEGPTSAMVKCMNSRFGKQISGLPLNQSLNDSSLVASRMAEAISGPPDSKDRYTFIPAAVGDHPGTLQLDEQGMRGGIIRGGVPTNSGTTRIMKVPIVDVVSWMVKYFREEDYLVMKMDAEGAEHGIFDGLFAANKFGILDVIAYECHPAKSDKCNDLNRRIDRAATSTGALVLREGNGAHSYQGIDRYSTPDKYFPINPSS